ncbi:hypothetical protein [Streptomyces sp. NPDC058625]|uniref:hypothetical protein n=1 Tax=Streptomyces sp. NPDC058625 TaxID=3346564 RepID=UPI003658F1D2
MAIEIDDWTCRFNFPDGWVDLTAAADLDARGKTAWVQEVVDSMNPLDLVVSRESIEKDLISLLNAAEELDSVLAATYFAVGGASYANFDVQVFGEDDTVLSLDEVESRLRSHRRIVGEPAVSRVDLPAGPAVRFQAMYQTKGVLGFGKRLSEGVSYATLVPQTSDVLLATMSWRSMEHSDQLTEMADSFIPTLRHVPLDAQGNPIGESGDPVA